METVFNGIPCIRLASGAAEAYICPGMGANCISLRIGGSVLLREPACEKDFVEGGANVYGMPFLFPPNRIRRGVYQYDGREYRFPVNEPARGNHIHGFLSETPFELVKLTADEAVFRYRATADAPYLTFPHAFTVVREWKLSPDGLFQKLTVTNDSDLSMPVGVGFHTALNVCFTEDTDPQNYRLKMDALDEIVYDPQTIIPTGEVLTDTDFLKALNGEGIRPQGERISRHMRRGKNGAELIHLPTGRRMHYRIGDTMPFWMLWNWDAQTGFICPEPQSWMVDAPNQSQDTAVSGFRAIAPGENFVTEMELKLEA